jgi:hypothetical protein
MNGVASSPVFVGRRLAKKGRHAKAAAGGPAAPKEFSGLTSAVGALVSVVVLLPVLGSIVLVVEYLTVPAIPIALAFRESTGAEAYRGWLVLLVTAGPLVAAGLAPVLRGLPIRMLASLIALAAAALVLVTPWPYVALSAVAACALGLWFLVIFRDTAPRALRSPAAVALVVFVGGALVVLSLGMTPSGGQPIYVVSSKESVLQTGWYIQLADSLDPVYLLTCSGDGVISAPAKDIEISRYGTAQIWNVSLAGHFVTSQPLPRWGLTPACPTSPPLH